jgi:hypothetical protein
MPRKTINRKNGDGAAKMQKRGAAMLDIIVLAAALIFLLAACAASIPEAGNTSGSPVSVSDSPAASADVSADTAAPAEPSPEVPYPEYALTDTSGGGLTECRQSCSDMFSFDWRLNIE